MPVHNHVARLTQGLDQLNDKRPLLGIPRGHVTNLSDQLTYTACKSLRSDLGGQKGFGLAEVTLR